MAAPPSLITDAYPDWRNGDAYRELVGADPSAFAWEWLRRTPDYIHAWNCGPDCGSPSPTPHPFGLERFENPILSVPFARPVWRRDILPDALTAHIDDGPAALEDRLDLRLLAPLVTIVIDGDDIEHLLLCDGRHFLRIDIVTGTLIGCPSALIYLLRGLTCMNGPIASIKRLTRLVQARHFPEETLCDIQRYRRWIHELRVADALRDRAPHQDIARAIFGDMVSARAWRTESSSYRRRIQRLVANARQKMRHPLAQWFSKRPRDTS